MAEALGSRPGGRAGKSPEAFRTISEVAHELDVPQHVLRFWESKFNQVKPLKRGGGRRYDRPLDVELLKGIRRLLYTEGYTIRGVQKILREKGAKAVIATAGSGATAATGIAYAAGVASVTALHPLPGAGAAGAGSDRAAIEAVLDELKAVRDLLGDSG